MLQPVTKDLQPFRFVSLAADDHRRLGDLVERRSTHSQPEPDWMEKLRTASAKQREPRRWWFKTAEVVGMLMAGLATAACVLHFGPHFGLHLSLLK